MNRVEFMETLSRLLQDIPEEDRIDALKYYNDYFDDAGSENEQNVIEELESPEKVAMKIKADREDTEDGKEGGTEKTTEEAIGKVTGEVFANPYETEPAGTTANTVSWIDQMKKFFGQFKDSWWLIVPVLMILPGLILRISQRRRLQRKRN